MSGCLKSSTVNLKAISTNVGLPNKSSIVNIPTNVGLPNEAMINVATMAIMAIVKGIKSQKTANISSATI